MSVPQEAIPEYDNTFDLASLDKYTHEITEDPEEAAARIAKEKAQKDALFDAIMSEELTRMANEAKVNDIDLIPQVKPQPKAAPKTQASQKAAVPSPSAASVPPKKEKLEEKKQKKKHSSKIAVFIIAGIVLVLAIAICGLFIMDRGTIVDNLYIAGVNVGGLSKDDAILQVDSATNELYRQNDLVLSFPDEDVIVSSDDSMVHLDTIAAVDSAYKYGRVLGLLKVPGITVTPAERTDIDLEPFFEFNSDKVQSILREKADAVYADLKQSEIKIEERPIEKKPEETENKDEDDDDSDTSDEDSDEDDDENKKPERTTDTILQITKGITARSLDTEELYNRILNSFSTIDFTPLKVKYLEKAPDPINLKEIYDKNCILPIDARYNPDTGELIPEVLGYGFEIDEVKKQIANAKEGETIEIPFTDLIPDTTLDDLEGYMFNDQLAAYDSPHTAIYNRTHNLELACAALNGTIINDGEVFSFNNIVGERTVAKGYKPAAIYIDGDTEDQTGGGVCQVASTIYMCALMSDMEILERSAHYFQVTYVPLGMDATIYWGSLDFRFRNNTGYPIRIEASVYGGYVHIAFYGTNTKNYTVQMTYDVVGYSAEGTSVISYKHKIDSDGNEISVAKEASSFYHVHKPKTDENDDDNPDQPTEEPPAVDPEPPAVDPEPPVVDPQPPVDPEPPVVDPEPPVVDPEPPAVDPDPGVE